MKNNELPMKENYWIESLFIYPVKSLAGIPVDKSNAEIRGFQYDRRWMVTDASGNYLSQKTLPAMALLKTSLTDNGILIQPGDSRSDPVLVPFKSPSHDVIKVKIFDDTVEAMETDPAISRWLSGFLGLSCKLVYMEESTNRYVSRKYSIHQETVSFANSFPYLIISQASFDDLNNRLTKKIPVNRFRPNLVIGGGDPYFEDGIDELSAGEVHFKCMKPCARCKIITVNQETALLDDEPLSVLSSYRKSDNDINFGYRSLCLKEGEVHVGDPVTILSARTVLHQN